MYVLQLKFVLNHRNSIVASENGEKPSSSQEIDILSVQKVGSPYLLFEMSAMSRGDLWQKEKIISVTILIVVVPQASGQTLK